MGARPFLLPFGDKWSGLMANTFTHRAVSIALFFVIVGGGGLFVCFERVYWVIFCVNMTQSIESLEEGISAEEMPS